ncbi:GTP cyclohydrolase I FolE [Salibacter sp.]|jgi:GTP cyclohydrolase I|uniref:GTP cyclohydrolase I FolE n=1 Tax=Salibacter sp. TaxID=2010995 RepID=UPI002870929D|nr:GTP cyclohydrolase I FolE [Salibacter sp.]MDR9399615.1 GTP cyclohydrolase I FolE [Salibacter sp.]MDR9487914.1 GTP cyclohydrolase I FolE [Salibacter sp.]
MSKEENKILTAEEVGDTHMMSSIDTPMRKDAFDLSDEEKIERIEEYFGKIMETLGLDLTDDSLQGTPHRVAKLYVKDLFNGLKPEQKPRAATFDNKYDYSRMLVEKNITVNSACEHHFMPIIGNAHVAYISSGNVIGLSKINRIVEYYSRRPQVQERLALQILNELKQVLKSDDVAVLIEAKHLCVTTRGIRNENTTTITAEYSGKFNEQETKQEFLDYIKHDLMPNK